MSDWSRRREDAKKGEVISQTTTSCNILERVLHRKSHSDRQQSDQARDGAWTNRRSSSCLEATILLPKSHDVASPAKSTAILLTERILAFCRPHSVHVDPCEPCTVAQPKELEVFESR